MDWITMNAKLLNPVRHLRPPQPLEIVSWPTDRTAIKRLHQPREHDRGLRRQQEELKAEDLELLQLEVDHQPVPQPGKEREHLLQPKDRRVVAAPLVIREDLAPEIVYPPTISKMRNLFLQSPFYPALHLHSPCRSV
jgi:hypothetical protein